MTFDRCLNTNEEYNSSFPYTYELIVTVFYGRRIYEAEYEELESVEEKESEQYDSQKSRFWVRCAVQVQSKMQINARFKYRVIGGKSIHCLHGCVIFQTITEHDGRGENYTFTRPRDDMCRVTRLKERRTLCWLFRKEYFLLAEIKKETNELVKYNREKFFYNYSKRWNASGG